jgi:hypothetical protein
MSGPGDERMHGQRQAGTEDALDVRICGRTERSQTGDQFDATGTETRTSPEARYGAPLRATSAANSPNRDWREVQQARAGSYYEVNGGLKDAAGCSVD